MAHKQPTVAETLQSVDNSTSSALAALRWFNAFPYSPSQFGSVSTDVHAWPRNGAARKGKILMKLDFRQRLLATTLMVGAGMLATPAFAQEAPATDPAAQTPTGPVEAAPVPDTSATGAPVEETRDIVVTGTRIPSANLDSVAPVTVVSGQDFKLQGNTRVEDMLNSLPSVGASQASGVSYGATGTA